MKCVVEKPLAKKLVVTKIAKKSGKSACSDPLIRGIIKRIVTDKIRRKKRDDVLRGYKTPFKNTNSERIRKMVLKKYNKKILDKAFSGEWISFEEIKTFTKNYQEEFSEYGESLRYGGFNNLRRKRARTKQNKMNPLDDNYNRNFVEDREI